MQIKICLAPKEERMLEKRAISAGTTLGRLLSKAESRLIDEMEDITGCCFFSAGVAIRRVEPTETIYYHGLPPEGYEKEGEE